MRLLMIFGFMEHRSFPFFFFSNSHYLLIACRSMLATQSVTLKMDCIKVAEGDQGKDRQCSHVSFSL